MKSGLIDKLEPNDNCMADSGFDIRDLVAKRRATLNIPPLSKGKQLYTEACTQTRRIAAVRIHVERAIQRLKGFKSQCRNISRISNQFRKIEFWFIPPKQPFGMVISENDIKKSPSALHLDNFRKVRKFTKKYNFYS